jgi:hypothetical protein
MDRAKVFNRTWRCGDVSETRKAEPKGTRFWVLVAEEFLARARRARGVENNDDKRLQTIIRESDSSAVAEGSGWLNDNELTVIFHNVE